MLKFILTLCLLYSGIKCSSQATLPSKATVTDTFNNYGSTLQNIQESVEDLYSTLSSNVANHANNFIDFMFFSMNKVVPYFDYIMKVKYGRDYKLNDKYKYWNQLNMNTDEKIGHNHLMNRYYGKYKGDYDAFLKSNDISVNPHYKKFGSVAHVDEEVIDNLVKKYYPHLILDNATKRKLYSSLVGAVSGIEHKLPNDGISAHVNSTNINYTVMKGLKIHGGASRQKSFAQTLSKHKATLSSQTKKYVPLSSRLKNTIQQKKKFVTNGIVDLDSGISDNEYKCITSYIC